MRKRCRQLLGLCLALALLMSLVCFPQSNVEASEIKVKRLEGQNRFETAVKVAQEGWTPAETHTVFLARSDDFADALTGTPLAYLNNAPILLTRTDELPAVTETELKRLKPQRVVLLGGEAAISPAVEQKLAGLGYETQRIGGQNRYETALKIAEEMRTFSGTNSGQAILAYGGNYPDALSIAPYAARQRIPILLTQSDQLPEYTRQYTDQVNSTIVIGGTGVISTAVEKDVPNPQRIAGTNRYETSVKVVEELGMSTSKIMMATGESFADALTGSVLAAKRNQPVLLTRSDRLDPATQKFVNRYDPKEVVVVGGEAAVSNAIILVLQGIDQIKIFIDPGHGGHDPGAVGNGMREAELALEISLMVRDILLSEYKNVQVKMSRETDVFIPLSERAAMANQWGADYFVSIHHNAGGGTGFESYIFNNTSNPVTKEKRDIIHDHIMKKLKPYGVRDRGKKAANFAVLRETRMPAVLLELLFIDNTNDAQLLKDPKFRQELARAIAEGIAIAWNLPKK